MEVDRILREGERRQVTGVPTSTWYDLIDQGLAPPGIKIGKYSVGWPATELAALNAARIAGKGDDEIRGLVKRLIAARAKAFDRFAAA